MNDKELVSFKKWFADYCASFATPVQEDQRNISVKQNHTHEVCLNALQIGRGLRMSRENLLLAETIALFHDVGRFPQYRQYKTFDDSISVNHAALGAKELREQKVLEGLPKHDQNLVVHAVALHNAFSLPEGLDERTRLFTRLVRDADKLDILRVFIEYYSQDADSRATAVALGLPDTPAYSPEILACLARGEMATKSNLRTLNDFKLLQLSWLYDMNFPISLQMVHERRYVDTIATLLPDDDAIREAVESVQNHVKRKRAEG
jgi:putative nucleotidyltransferase with HDIG domain